MTTIHFGYYEQVYPIVQETENIQEPESVPTPELSKSIPPEPVSQTKPDTSNMHIILINMPHCTDRLRRMKKRLDGLGLLYTILVAQQDSEDYRNWKNGHEDKTESRVNVTYNHLQAYKYFLSRPEWQSCIIMEDDALLHKDFVFKFNNMLAYKPSSCKGILLSPYHTQILTTDFHVTGELFELRDHIFSCCAYYVERDFAQMIVDVYAVPVSLYPLYRKRDLTPEYFLGRSIGCCCVHPPLCVEDCIDTNNPNAVGVDQKREYWASYGYENYVDID